MTDHGPSVTSIGIALPVPKTSVSWKSLETAVPDAFFNEACRQHVRQAFSSCVRLFERHVDQGVSCHGMCKVVKWTHTKQGGHVMALGGGGGGLLIALVSIIVAIGIALLIREIVMWYWKINQIVENQEEEIRLLKELVKKISNKE
jgi:hypothetical protein